MQKTIQEEALEDSRPKLIAHLTKFGNLIESYSGEYKELKVDQDEYNEIFQLPADEIQLPDPITDEEKIAELIYTVEVQAILRGP